ncbi:hypothetical protein MMC30_004664 [Trapelia coarctata]|nr:hypothetical protein [Trapelia coarctata]
MRRDLCPHPSGRRRQGHWEHPTAQYQKYVYLQINNPPGRLLTTRTDKDKWIDLERRRWASQFNIPVANKMPDGFPVATLAPQRFVAAVSLVAPEKIEDVIAALYHAFFVELRPISKPDDFMPIVEPVLGKETAAKALETSTGNGKKLLSANTEKVILDGAFGLPWFEAINGEGKKEFYWGFDHIGQVADHLGLEKPQPGSAGEGGWKAML